MNYPARLAYRGDVPAGYDQERLGDAYRRFVWRREFAAIRRVLEANVAKGASVLDVPTGTGRFLPLLQQSGLRVRGADISREMLHAARARVPEVGFSRCEAERLPFRDGSFDHVFSLRFVGHLPPPVRIRVLREFSRIAREGLIVGYPILNLLTDLRFRAGNAIRRLRTGQPRPWWPATEEALAGELKAAGLRIADREAVFKPLEQVSILYLVPDRKAPKGAPLRQDTRVAFAGIGLERLGRYQPLFRELTRIFPETTVLSGRWPGFVRGCEGTFRVKSLPGVRQIPLKLTETGHSEGFAWVSPAVLVELVRLRPDVMLTMGFNLWTLYGILLKSMRRCRLVLLWQGVSPETGGTAGTFRYRLRRRMARWIDAAVTNTDGGERYLRETVGVRPDRILNGIYEVAERSAPIGSAAGQKSTRRLEFLFVGRLTRGKGVHVLLQACSILLKRGQDSFSVVLVGEGSQGQEMKDLAAGLSGHVKWEGAVTRDRVEACFDRCDVFVLPSLEDTWGVVVMEALAYGKPVICSRLAGVSRVVEHESNGFVFDPGRPEELADFMERFIRNPELARRFGSKSLELAASFTPERAARLVARSISLAIS
ncbi:MAG TPA: glycosyltransferase [Planctomycetota bacterium]|nr:glycosyltransferase [Planctomycetota bacterium]